MFHNLKMIEFNKFNWKTFIHCNLLRVLRVVFLCQGTEPSSGKLWEWQKFAEFAVFLQF